jgi:ubiquinone/menaquinone biosynthesis C-methylase UbiE
MIWNRWPSFLLLLSLASCAAPAPRDPAPSPAVVSPPPAAVTPRATTEGSAAFAPAAPPEPAPAASPAPTEAEASVRPGANEQYLQPDTDVNAWLERFERGGREIFDQRQAILAATGVARGQVVADVGAGTGLFSRLFARAVGPTGKVYAVDIVPKFLRHIENESRRQGITNITTVRGQERSTALPADSVDLIFLCDSYHHFEYPRSMNASMLKALRPGGTLILIDFRRVAGQSPAWILEHVRAGEEVFTRELQAAGFEKVGDVPLLKENYMVRFRKPAAGAAARR